MTGRKKKVDEAALRAAILDAALKHVPFDGFTDKVLARASEQVGASKTELTHLFPEGALDLVTAFSEAADGEMERSLAACELAKMKVRERIRTAVLLRIDALRPHKEAARRAAAFLSLPPHAGRALTLLYRTVDAMWRGVGDTATDFSFYTKRATLAGVYSTTLMRWFNDQSEDETATKDFLDARIANVMQFEKFKAQVKDGLSRVPSPGAKATRRSAPH